MIALELKVYAGVGAVAALLVWSAFRPIQSRHRFAYGAMLAFVALLLVALVLPDLKQSTGNAVIRKLFSALCGAALVAFICLLWGAWQAKRWGRRLQLAALAILLFLIVSVALPNFVPARVANARSACSANLQQIQNAKNAWAAKFNKSTIAVPQNADLFGPNTFIHLKPVCPAGGTYRLRAVGEKPTCSVSAPGHTLDFNR